MGNKINLALDVRTLHGKKVKQLRKDGLVPGVIYGASTEPISVQVAYNVFEKTYRQAGTHAPLNLAVDGKKKIAMIKEVDIDPVRGEIRHISFHAVKATDPVTATVPIHLIGEGESEAEKNGLIILQTLDNIEVKALPMDLPESIEISTAGLKDEGEKLTLASATLPDGVEYIEHSDGRTHDGDEDEDQAHVTDQVVASVWEPGALQAANESSAGDAEDESEVESENGSDGANDGESEDDKSKAEDEKTE